METPVKPFFIPIPNGHKTKEMVNSPAPFTPISGSPSDPRSGANTPSHSRTRSSVSSNVAVSTPPVVPNPNATSPTFLPATTDFAVRRSALTISDRSSYFPPAPPELFFQKHHPSSYQQPVV